jgi:hypothetical protein
MPKFDDTVSFGNVLVVMTLLVSIVAGWVANRERSFTNAENIGRIEAYLETLDQRVRILEIAGGSGGK